MRKTVVQRVLLGAILAATSAQTLAYGSGGTLGGNPSLSREQLEANWNGKPGPQVTAIAGIVTHWTADACGTFNGKQFDPINCDTKKAKQSPTDNE